MAGRPSKRTPARVQGLCNALRQGQSRTAACAHVGINRETFYLWLDNPAFSGAVAKAEAEAEAKFLAPIQAAADSGDWRAGLAWLERRRPADYALKATLEAELTLDVSDLLRQHLVRPTPDPLPLPAPTIFDVPPPESNGHTNGHLSQD